MRFFLKKIILFILTLGILFVLPGVVIVLGKEYVSYKDVVEVQIKYPKSLFGFAYNGEPFYFYKELLVSTRHPKVVALGTSRVMQFREEFFTKETLFTNAGGAGKSLEDIELFIERLPATSSVQVIILGLDKEVFISPYHTQEQKKEQVLPVRLMTILISMSRRIYLDYFTHKYSLSTLFEVSKKSHNIGIAALLHYDGFRNDGSYRYGGAIDNPNRVLQLKSYIKNSTDLVSDGSDKDTNLEEKNLEINYQALNRILILAKTKKITIIGILPPYPTLVYNEMLKNDKVFVSFSNKMSDIFRINQEPFFDFSSIRSFGGKDTEFVDAIHGTDVMYLKMFMYMIKHTEKLDIYTDEKILNEMFKKVQGDFLLF